MQTDNHPGNPMKNHNPSGGQLRLASAGQRLMALLVFATLAALIWLASSGRYDHEINDFAGWLRSAYQTLTR